jgi:hypothetical protein
MSRNGPICAIAISHFGTSSPCVQAPSLTHFFVLLSCIIGVTYVGQRKMITVPRTLKTKPKRVSSQEGDMRTILLLFAFGNKLGAAGAATGSKKV